MIFLYLTLANYIDLDKIQPTLLLAAKYRYDKKGFNELLDQTLQQGQDETINLLKKIALLLPAFNSNDDFQNRAWNSNEYFNDHILIEAQNVLRHYNQEYFPSEALKYQIIHLFEKDMLNSFMQIIKILKTKFKLSKSQKYT